MSVTSILIIIGIILGFFPSVAIGFGIGVLVGWVKWGRH